MKNILAICSVFANTQISLQAQGKEFFSTFSSKASHSEMLLQEISLLLEKAQIKPNQINAFVVVNGPGSFTGVRVGMAIAKGFAVAVPNMLLATVCSLDFIERCTKNSIGVVNGLSNHFFCFGKNDPRHSSKRSSNFCKLFWR